MLPDELAYNIVGAKILIIVSNVKKKYYEMIA